MLFLFYIIVFQSICLRVTIFNLFHRFISKKLSDNYSKCLGMPLDFLCVFWYHFSDTSSLSILWFNPLPRLRKDSTSWPHHFTRMPHFTHPSLISGVCKLLVPCQLNHKFKVSKHSPRLDNWLGWLTEFCVILYLWSLFCYERCRWLTRLEMQTQGLGGLWVQELVSMESSVPYSHILIYSSSRRLHWSEYEVFIWVSLCRCDWWCHWSCHQPFSTSLELSSSTSNQRLSLLDVAYP